MIVDVWKKSNMTSEQFKKRWLIEHGALVKEHAKAMGFVKYIQSHKLPSPEIEAFAAERGWRPPSDGLTEIWWESMDSMQAAMSSIDGQKASAILQQDEVQFINAKKISAYLAEEKVIFDYQDQ